MDVGTAILTVLAVASLAIIASDVFFTERRRRRSLRDYFAPQDDGLHSEHAHASNSRGRA